MPISLIVHAGAWEIPDDEVSAHINACQRTLAAGWQILRDSGSALDAMQAAIIMMEDAPALDAGLGSLLTADGTIELDAPLCCHARQRFAMWRSGDGQTREEPDCVGAARVGE